MPLTFEDFQPGHFATLGPRHVTRAEIIAFASEFDPQPMHLDDEAAKLSMAGSLTGSGWHMCALAMRMQVDGIINRSESLGGLGVDEVKWLAPLRPGDDLTLEVHVDEARPSKSRADRGIVKIRAEMFNASGTRLMTLVSNGLMRRRVPDMTRRGKWCCVIFFEDTRLGERRSLGSFVFTAEAIKAFAQAYDPQAFHLDEEAGRKSLFGGLAASGWHTASVYMKLLVANIERQAAAAKAEGRQVAQSGPSPGFKNLKWPRPVLAGDTITYFYEATSMRPLASRPGWGIVFGTATALNQRGDVVLFFENSVFLPCRSQSA